MKRVVSFVLFLAVAFSCSCGAAFAADAPDIRASLTISSYNVTLKAGSSQGTIIIGYDVKASRLADSVGVESITIYKSDGSFVTTITGTTANGLTGTDNNINKGTYSYAGTSGVSYYAKVTVFAKAGSDYDSRTVTTATVKAP